jgi:hypothetical protein
MRFTSLIATLLFLAPTYRMPSWQSPDWHLAQDITPGPIQPGLPPIRPNGKERPRDYAPPPKDPYHPNGHRPGEPPEPPKKEPPKKQQE